MRRGRNAAVCGELWHAKRPDFANPTAACKLGLTQPTIARHLNQLAQALGADLLLRWQRRPIVTDLALELLPQAEAPDRL